MTDSIKTFPHTPEIAGMMLRVLQSFPYFIEYAQRLGIAEWLAIALSFKLRRYGKLSPVIQSGESSNNVHLILRGDTAVIMGRKNDYTLEHVLENKIVVLKPGSSFGEVGVIYERKR